MRRKGGHHKSGCDCDLCQFSRTLPHEIESLEEFNGDVLALLKDGSLVLTPFFLPEGMAVN